MKFKVELTTKEEFPKILKIYENARKFMKENGNYDQWKDNHPSISLLNEFFEAKNLYNLKNMNNEIVASFAFIIGDDPTYEYIEGEWINENKYGTIHSLASSLKEKGTFNEILNFCFSKIDTIRIDTSFENHIVQHLLEKYGFIKCGIIYVNQNEPRLAYSKTIIKVQKKNSVYLGVTF